MKKELHSFNIRKYTSLLLLTFITFSCGTSSKSLKNEFISDQIPTTNPLPFKRELIPADKLIHKGTFSPDLSEYYYTLSDQNFEKFDVYMIRKSNDQWSDPEMAFFNSEYSDHGMSFSPDGSTMYFSSTRPTNREDVLTTWHIWKSEQVNGNWTEPEFVDIPNLKDQLVSHPTISNQGALYFHASNLDYSQMDLYRSQLIDGQFGPAALVGTGLDAPAGKCTPHVSADESYLIYATIGNELELYVSFNGGDGNWTGTKRLNDLINNSGQGNPYVTPDDQFLFFTTSDQMGQNWQVKWVDIKNELTQK